MRRDANDKEWQKVKAIVKDRDNNRCRLCRVLSIQEALLLKKKAGQWLNILDPAHYISVSSNPEIMYDPNNICLLNRYSHQMLDSSCNPITGEQIDENEIHNWWVRIINGNREQAKYLKEKGLL